MEENLIFTEIEKEKQPMTSGKIVKTRKNEKNNYTHNLYWLF